MVMQAALRLALEHRCFCRPVGEKGYAYSYVSNGKNQVVHVYGRDGRGTERSEECACFTQRELEDEWMLCDRDGSEWKAPVKGSLSDLLAES